MVGIIAPAVAIIAADEARKMLGDSAQQFGDGGPEYIRAGQPQSIVGKVGQAVARHACRRYSDGSAGIDSSKAAAYEKACRPYLNDIAYDSPPSIGKPFSGGQCYGVQYRVTTAFTSPPIGEQTNEQLVSARVLGTYRGDRQPNQLIPVGLELQGAPDGPITRLNVASLSDDSVSTFRIQSIVREDGLPDNCGDPAPVVKPPVPPPTPTPRIIPIVIAPDVNINTDVVVNIDGTIDVDIGTGPIKIDPFGDKDGTGGGDGGGDGGAPGGAEGGPVLPGGNGGFGGDDELGPPPAGQRWVGVCMAITARPDGFGVVKSNTVDKVYPIVVGNVRLICEAMGTEIVNTPVPIRSDRVCLWEPARGVRVVAIRVNLEPGFGYQYQGYAVPVDN